MSCQHKPDCKNEQAMKYLEALVWGEIQVYNLYMGGGHKYILNPGAHKLITEIQEWLLEQKNET